MSGRQLGLSDERSGAFVDNMRLPVHRWFRYSAGFSAAWVQSLIHDASRGGTALAILDPFAGSGTTLIAAQQAGAFACGVEAHAFVARVARAKLHSEADIKELAHAAAKVAAAAKKMPRTPEILNTLLMRCFAADALDSLARLRAAYEQHEFACHAVRDLVWLAITSILRECSGVGTAQWQYILPNKTKAKISDPLDAFRKKIDVLMTDIALGQPGLRAPRPLLLQADARQAETYRRAKRKFDLVVTSPPYPNNYDYADATRLEMTFWGELGNWGDLHGAIRKDLVCSCSQHSAAERYALDRLLDDDAVAPIRAELEPVCRKLEAVRQEKGGRKTYHTMVARYFIDLAHVWAALRPVMKQGSRLHFVIGDSAPYGVHVPSDIWLGELAIAAGFKSFAFEKIRDRNTKWKNRKHRVPLREGILVVEG